MKKVLATISLLIFIVPNLAFAALTDSLVSYWKLDESSGNAADSVASNTLTNTGSMTYGTGKINNGAQTTTGKYLVITDANQTGLDLTGDLTFNFWVNFTTTPGSNGEMYFINKYGQTSGTDSYLFELFNNAGTMQLYAAFASDGTNPVAGAVDWTPSTGTWYMVSEVYTAAAHSVSFYVNGTQQGTAQDVTVTSIWNGTADFFVGSYKTGGLNLNGTIDELGVWSRTLSGTELTSLYNSAAGIQYPFSSTPSGSTGDQDNEDLWFLLFD